MRPRLIDAHAAAASFGWTVGRLRVWRHRHPDVLPVAGHGPHGVALFRTDDWRHAHDILDTTRDDTVTSECG